MELKARIKYYWYSTEDFQIINRKVEISAALGFSFKIINTSKSGASVKVLRYQSYRLISERKYYEGQHEVSIVINGKGFEKGLFNIGL
jgi:hypothetical protein